jgi:hypothetical protein
MHQMQQAAIGALEPASKWTYNELRKFKVGLAAVGRRNWTEIARSVKTKDEQQCWKLYVDHRLGELTYAEMHLCVFTRSSLAF